MPKLREDWTAEYVEDTIRSAAIGRQYIEVDDVHLCQNVEWRKCRCDDSGIQYTCGTRPILVTAPLHYGGAAAWEPRR